MFVVSVTSCHWQVWGMERIFKLGYSTSNCTCGHPVYDEVLGYFLENNSSPTRFDKVQRSIHINASKYIVMMLFQRLTDYVLASLLEIRFRQVCQNVIWTKNQVCQNVIWTKNQVWQNVIWTKNQISTKHVSAGV